MYQNHGEETQVENKEIIMERVKLAGLIMDVRQEIEYLNMADDLGEVTKGATVPDGYKRCGKCGHSKKYFLFNKNAGSKTNTSGSCKECQKANAKKSYGKTKQRRNYKKYYQENKEIKQAHARKYYEENKERLKEKHQEYLKTAKGKRVMKKAHAKRRKSLAENAGIPYTREMIIERDGAFLDLEHPECYLCGKAITDTSGTGLHLDHVIPVVQGGLDCFTNMASTHTQCNLRREKDARELTTEQVEDIQERSEAFIDAYPERFES